MARTRKPKRTRKVRSDSEGRTRLVTVKLTPQEHDAIAAAVSRENAEALADPTATADDKRPATVSSWIRDHALDPLGLATFEAGP